MKPTLFIDRDGTLIEEPKTDFQVDTLDKLYLEAGVVSALLALQQHYCLVMVSNQDGLGTSSFPKSDFDRVHDKMMHIFNSQGIAFDDVFICPHFAKDDCDCRKPKTQLLQGYIEGNLFDKTNSFVIGDRQTDMTLAQNLGIQGILYSPSVCNWQDITRQLIQSELGCQNPTHTANRHAKVVRKTKETNIEVEVWLDEAGASVIKTGVGFFDHMLEQIATHGGFKLHIECQGDLWIDEHHTVEDTAIALGLALKQALGDKVGIARFGFVLPMDECLARCVMDLSGRPFIKFKAKFNRQKVGDFSTELTEHFFASMAYSMMATLHIKAKGKNDHHKIESLFKVFGRTLRQCIAIQSSSLPSSKGVL